ncbi:glycoprotein [Ceratitis capitata sigmavirus]|uniref:Spike glycoprotein n=17 Tax=root TaxID=1 RepID=W8B747_CERCA|nr:glycoprotein [Ceratitis capitata sigmavirus]AMK09270.1 glycoprotein [Ceratitis capitata sigmavirus]
MSNRSIKNFKMENIINKYRLVIYFSLILLDKFNTIKSESFSYPTSRILNWNPVSYNYLTCPQHHTSYDSTIHKHLDEILVRKPIYNDNLFVDGYLCRKVAYITRCVTSWTFTSSINKLIHGLSVSRTECLEKIKQLEEDELIQERFKEPDCRWNKIYDVESINFEIINHKVKLDPYTNNLVDPIFPGGITHSSKSATIHNDVIWISKVNTTFTCNRHIEMKGIVYTKLGVSERNLSGEIAMLHIEGFKDKSFQGACLLMYCNEQGVRFSDGEWISISYDLNFNHSFTNLLSDLNPCSSTVSLSLSNNYQRNIITMELTLETIFRLRCEDTIAKLINHIPITPYDVSFLAQSYPGPGNVYQIRDNVLMQAQGLYELLLVNSSESNGDVIGYHVNGTAFIEDRWYTDNHKSIHGLNGIVKFGGRIRYPGDIFKRRRTHDSLLKAKPLLKVSHPTVLDLSKIINSTDIEYGYHPNSVLDNSILEDTISEIKYLWSHLFDFSVLGQILWVALVVIVLVIGLSSYKVWRRVRETQTLDDIESINRRQNLHFRDIDSLRSLGVDSLSP